MATSCRVALVGSLALLNAPLFTTQAQVVEGRIGRAGDGPAQAVLVALLDDSARVVARVVTGAGGRFELIAPAPGSYRIEIRQPGRRPWLSDPVDLGEDVVVLSPMPDAEAVILPDLTAEATGRCRSWPAIGAATRQLLDAARIGLLMAEAARMGGGPPGQLLIWQRSLDPQQHILTESRTPARDAGGWPFKTLPVDSVAVVGFVYPTVGESAAYYALDAGTFASEWFASTHCFNLVLPEFHADSIVGLTFEPESRILRPDVRGTVWLDRRTQAIQRLDFRYTGLGRWLPGDAAGGAIDFGRSPDGALVLTRWWLRLPVAAQRATRDPLLLGYAEVGGEVMGPAPGSAPGPGTIAED
ncbi:MAG: carboxypeptidase-like regulatory domain-containing protein [Gemmatimonadales bacterium]